MKTYRTENVKLIVINYKDRFTSKITVFIDDFEKRYSTKTIVVLILK